MKRKLLFIGLFVFLVLTGGQSVFAQGETCATAVAVTPGNYSADGPSTGGGIDNVCFGSGGTNADWYSYTPTVDGTIKIESTTSGGDTRLSFSDGVCGALNCVASDDDGGSGWLSLIDNVSVTAGTTYYIQWDDRWDDAAFDWYLTFTPLPTCFEPSNQTETNVTAISADLGWTTGGSSTWNIEYGPLGFAQGTGTLIMDVSSNPYPISGLSSGTSYDWYVRDSCGVGDVSTWVGPNTFVTLCTTFTAPYSEDFESGGSIPNCWSQGTSNAENWKFSNTGFGNHLGNNGTMGGSTTSGGYFAWVDDSYPHSQGITLESPMIDVSGLTDPELSFFLISDNEGHTNVDFSVDVWDGAAWNVGFYTHNTNTYNGEWEKIHVALSSLTISGDIQFRFIVDENNGSDYYDDVAIDDVTVDEAPACPPPSSLVVTDETSSSARLSWIAGSGVPGYNWQVVPEGNDPDDNPVAQGSVFGDTNVVANGLDAATTYDAYVQSDCSGGPRANGWIGPVTFTTACNTVTTFPLSEGFENGGNIPMCWTTEFVSGSMDWTFENGGHSGHPAHALKGSYNALFYVGNYSQPITRLVSPSLDLTGATSPYLTFWHTQPGWAFGQSVDQDELRVYYKTSANGTWTLIPGAEWTNDIPDWKGEIISLPNPSADYYVAFEATGNWGYGVSIDDVQMGPIAPVTVSDWAIVIGVFFILTFLVVTYRRRFA